MDNNEALDIDHCDACGYDMGTHHPTCGDNSTTGPDHLEHAAALEALTTIYDELKSPSESGVDALYDICNRLNIGIGEVILASRERQTERETVAAAAVLIREHADQAMDF